MLKSELIKELIDDMVKYGDNEARVSIVGDSGSLEIDISGCVHYCYSGLNLDCDIDYYKTGAKEFLKDLKEINEEWE